MRRLRIVPVIAAGVCLMFALTANPSVGSAASAVGGRSGPVPNTILKPGLAVAAGGSSPVLRFASTVARSAFQCSLDGGPWRACTSPRRYSGLVDGRHWFAVRAISPSGRRDPTAAHVSWIVDTVAPKVTLRRPANRSTTSDDTPLFAGTGGAAATYSPRITVRVFTGSRTSGASTRTLRATVSGGTWSVAAARPLADGTYTAQAEQSDRAGRSGVSRPSTFTVDTGSSTGPSGGGGGTNKPPPTYSIGGTVSGLTGTVLLQDKGADDLSVDADGAFTFKTTIAAGGAYTVTVASDPSAEHCTVSGGSGTVASADVTNVAVNCVPSPPPTYSIGGTVSGLSGTVVLQDNGGDDLNLDDDGPFTFKTPVAAGAAYAVTVASDPNGEHCTVSDGAGEVAAAKVTSVEVSCVPSATQIGEDDFNRADGQLGASWTATSDGGLTIASDQVTGTSGPAYAGDIRTAAGESYRSDQYSQIEVGPNSVGPNSVGNGNGEWVGPTVRSKGNGDDAYVGIYFWNDGSPELQLYLRTGPTAFQQLGAPVPCGVLAAGTELTLTAFGSTISFAENGVAQITATDTTLTGGDPGIMTYDAATADNWSGGDAAASIPPQSQSMQVQYQGTDADGVASYDVVSSDDGEGAHVLRVMNPTDPAPGVPHNFLYVLPVEPELGTTYGDGLETLRALNAQNQYNLTIIEPSFAVAPWYADSSSDPNLQYETFMTNDLVPWVTKNLATTGKEQNWLIGFSKSGMGAQDLLLKHPDLFTAAASWDFPADMNTYTSDGGTVVGDGVNYGTDANFQSNYRLTQSFVDAHKAPFQSANRIWIGGFAIFATDLSDYDTLLNTEGIKHTTETPQAMAHRWDSGWVPIALSALSQDGAALPAAP